MRFYAVSTTAIDHTHRALQSLPQCRGGHGPSRALRVAQLYGHLQWRSDGNGEVVLALRELAASWHLQPHLLRADLQDLQSLGWLRYEGRPDGTWIQLHSHGANPSAPTTTTPSGTTPATPGATASGATGSGLLDAFVEHYNRHRPPSWPAYSPRSSSLQGRLQQAVAHAGSPDALWSLLQQALNAMPPFWRDTYPQGRSASDCVAVLLSTGRQNLGLGVEFWHLFRWSSSTAAKGGCGAAAGQGSEGTAGAGELEKARLLLVWDGHHWRGQGVAALHLPRSEKLRLALLLEDAGEGQPGAALAQYGPVEA